jgi:hypothetical protein
LQKPAAAFVRFILDKPVGLEEIRSVVSEALGRSELPPDNGRSTTPAPAARDVSRTPIRREGGERRDAASDLSELRHAPQAPSPLGGQAAFNEKVQT